MPTISRQTAIKQGIPAMGIQTILIPKQIALIHARQWLREHGFHSEQYRTTKNFHRFIQVLPIAGATYKTKRLTDGIEIVY